MDELESGLVAAFIGGLVAGLPLCLFGGSFGGRGDLAVGVCIDFGVRRSSALHPADLLGATETATPFDSFGFFGSLGPGEFLDFFTCFDFASLIYFDLGQ